MAFQKHTHAFNRSSGATFDFDGDNLRFVLYQIIDFSFTTFFITAPIKQICFLFWLRVCKQLLAYKCLDQCALINKFLLWSQEPCFVKSSPNIVWLSAISERSTLKSLRSASAPMGMPLPVLR